LLFDELLHADLLESNDLPSLIEKTAEASELLGQLRFFQIASKLAEAAYVLDANQQGHAVKAFAYLKKLDDFSDLMRFREIADQLMPSQLDPALSISPPDQAAVAAMRAKGLKSVADFYPAQIWTMRSNGSNAPRDQDLLDSTPKQEEQNLLPPI
jgi:hypothetical protein